MGQARLRAVASHVASDDPHAVVDLGCGHGALLLEVARCSPASRCVGLDLDVDAIADAHAKTLLAGLSDRATFQVADCMEWRGPCDVAICIGSSHAFGGPAEMFTRLGQLVGPGGAAMVGEGIWTHAPGEWCRQTFGDLPEMGELIDMAELQGWTVDDADLSSMEEWDEFEGGWAAGVEGVGTAEALAYAEERRSEYHRYRGTLGFAWLELRRVE